jgi:hypothetical protein
VGAVTENVRRIIPASYNAILIAPSDNRLFATADLQALADYVKYRLFSTIVSESQEAVLYSQPVNLFLGKLTTLQFIPAAIDYWDSQLSSIVATGTGEVANFRDHLSGLSKIWDRLTQEVVTDAKLLHLSLGKSGLLPKVSYGDNGRGILITPDPQTFPPLESNSDWVTIPWKTVA